LSGALHGAQRFTVEWTAAPLRWEPGDARPPPSSRAAQIIEDWHAKPLRVLANDRILRDNAELCSKLVRLTVQQHKVEPPTQSIAARGPHEHKALSLCPRHLVADGVVIVVRIDVQDLSLHASKSSGGWGMGQLVKESGRRGTD